MVDVGNYAYIPDVFFVAHELYDVVRLPKFGHFIVSPDC
jgi:hypothetical protein